MKEYILRYKGQVISISILLITSLILISVFWQFRNMHLNVPITYSGSDDYFTLNMAKTISETGWIFENDKLGAPFGAYYYDYPSLFFDNFDTLILKLLIIITGNSILAVNMQFILLFPMISLISYYVMKKIKINDYIAILGSLAFSFSPYIFYRGMYHTVLSTYEFIPLSILLCIWIYKDDSFLSKNESGFKYKKNYLALLFCVLISNNGIVYYPFFTCFLLLVTGLFKSINYKKLRYLLKSIFLIFVICIFLIINFIPVIRYIIEEGSNTAVANRSWLGAEIYGLKIFQLFLPMDGNGIPKLERLISVYNSNAPLINENVGSYLGIAGIIGFLILIVMMFYRNNDNELKKDLKFLSELNVSALLLGTIGGFGSAFAILVSPMIRAYNRISIIILYISILAICLVLNNLYYSKRKLITLISIFLFALSIFEQFPGNVPDYKEIENRFNTDKAFIQSIEKKLSDGAMIFQLPYHQYPEGGNVTNMTDYHLLTGYLHSKNLKWSYGGIKGRKSDLWNKYVASLDTETMIKTLSVAGFEGIYIDKLAYSEIEYQNMQDAISELLHINPIISDNRQLAFFDMTSYNRLYYENYNNDDLQRIRSEVLNNSILQLGEGFSTIEGDKPNQWIWISKNAQLIVDNNSSNQKLLELDFNIYSGYEELSNLEIYINDILYNKYTVNSIGTNININSFLKKGKNIIKFKTNARQIIAPNDPRDLFLRIDNFNFFDNNIKLK